MDRVERAMYAPPLLREPGFARIDPMGVARRSGEEDPRRGRMLLIVSVVVLLALLGVIWSTYRQGVREDGRDGPPFIMAIDGPTKVVPSDRGGVETEHLGIDVFKMFESRLAQAETAALGPEPPSAESLATEVQPGLAPSPGQETVASAGMAAIAALEARDFEAPAEAAQVLDSLAPEDFAPPGDLALVEESAPATAGPPIPRLKPLQRDPSEAAASGPEAGPRTLADADEERRYLARRLPMSPAPAPATQGTLVALGQASPPAAAAPAPEPAAAPPASAPPAPAPAPTVVTGTFMAQVASFRSAEQAQAGWAEFHGRFEELLQGYAPDVETADLGDRGVRYRLRVGVFTTRDAASGFCDEIKIRGGECLVVGS